MSHRSNNVATVYKIHHVGFQWLFNPNYRTVFIFCGFALYMRTNGQPCVLGTSHNNTYCLLAWWYHVKVWIILFPELVTWISSDAGIKSYWWSKAIENKEKHWNYDVNFFYFAISPLRHVTGFKEFEGVQGPGPLVLSLNPLK